MKKGIAIIAFIGVAMLMLVGCSKPPEKEMAAAKSALEAAKTAEAETYVPYMYQTAQETLNVALAEVEKQKQKNGLLRNYDASIQKLAASVKLAGEAETAVASQKEVLMGQAAQTIAKADEKLGEAKAKLVKPPKKVKKDVIAGLKKECDDIEKMISSAKMLMSNNNIMGAKEIASAAMDKASALADKTVNLIPAQAEKSSKKKK